MMIAKIPGLEYTHPTALGVSRNQHHGHDVYINHKLIDPGASWAQ